MPKELETIWEVYFEVDGKLTLYSQSKDYAFASADMQQLKESVRIEPARVITVKVRRTIVKEILE